MERTQDKHFFSCVERIISNVVRRLACTFGVLVDTSMPSETGYTQAVTKRAGRPPSLTSTMQMRQAPISLISFRKHRVGISTPA